MKYHSHSHHTSSIWTSRILPGSSPSKVNGCLYVWLDQHSMYGRTIDESFVVRGECYLVLVKTRVGQWVRIHFYTRFCLTTLFFIFFCFWVFEAKKHNCTPCATVKSWSIFHMQNWIEFLTGSSGSSGSVCCRVPWQVVAGLVVFSSDFQLLSTAKHRKVGVVSCRSMFPDWILPTTWDRSVWPHCFEQVQQGCCLEWRMPHDFSVRSRECLVPNAATDAFFRKTLMWCNITYLVTSRLSTDCRHYYSLV